MDCFKNMNEFIENLVAGAFLSVQSGNKKNTMTINWGYIGHMWNNPYFIALVRPSRYTYEFIKAATNFTVSLPKTGNLKEELAICGSKSGRDIDKSKIVTFLPGKTVDSPVIDGCQMYCECKINYVTPFDEKVIPEEIKNKNYQDNCFHTLFFGEIVDYYEK